MPSSGHNLIIYLFRSTRLDHIAKGGRRPSKNEKQSNYGGSCQLVKDTGKLGSGAVDKRITSAVCAGGGVEREQVVQTIHVKKKSYQEQLGGGDDSSSSSFLRLLSQLNTTFL